MQWVNRTGDGENRLPYYRALRIILIMFDYRQHTLQLRTRIPASSRLRLELDAVLFGTFQSNREKLPGCSHGQSRGKLARVERFQ